MFDTVITLYLNWPEIGLITLGLGTGVWSIHRAEAKERNAERMLQHAANLYQLIDMMTAGGTLTEEEED